jgi:hypothetical protein
MKKKQEWITELTEDIVRLKNAGRKTLYLISAEMNTETANGIVKHFLDHGYDVESNRCASCVNKWDLILQWE